MPSAPFSSVCRAARCVALAAIALTTVACGGDDSGWGRGFGGGGRKQIGVSLPSRAHPFYRELEAGLREAARRARYELLINDADFTPPLQRSQVDNLLGREVDAVLIAPVDTLGVVPAVARANAARVPVFTSNLRPDSGRSVSHVESDHVAMGRLAAEYLAAFLGNSGEIVIVTRPGVPWLVERERGFRTAIRERSGLRIIDSVDAGGSRPRAAETLTELLRARRETDAIFSVDDAGALGAYDAALTRYRTDLLIVGADPSPQTLELIRSEGPVKAAVLQQPRLIGRRAIELMVRHFDDQPVAPRVLVPVRLVNVDSLRPAGATAAARR